MQTKCSLLSEQDNHYFLYNNSMSRAAAIIIANNHIALIKRRRAGRLYYVFPGGQIEEGESPEQATIREIEEELGLNIAIDRLIVQVMFRKKKQYYFLSHITGGKFGTGQGPEMRGLYPPENGSYRAVWMPVASILRENVLPRTVAEVVAAAIRQGWPLGITLLSEE
jgi:8-oxo-dGTP diphosphatase